MRERFPREDEGGRLENRRERKEDGRFQVENEASSRIDVRETHGDSGRTPKRALRVSHCGHSYGSAVGDHHS